VSELVPTSHTFPLAMISRCLVESFLYNTKEVEALHHMEANGPDYTATRNRVNAHVTQVCLRRTFLTLSGGYIGLGPPMAQPGDEVVVLLGCCRPLVMRKRDNGYQLLGDAFFHGLQFGEAILGPLSDGWRRKTWNTFIHDDTAETTYADPRLRRFAKDGEKIEWKKDGYYAHYPELTPGRLKSCGVDIVEFDLI
jgi:hypothetical protein